MTASALHTRSQIDIERHHIAELFASLNLRGYRLVGPTIKMTRVRFIVYNERV